MPIKKSCIYCGKKFEASGSAKSCKACRALKPEMRKEKQKDRMIRKEKLNQKIKENKKIAIIDVLKRAQENGWSYGKQSAYEAGKIKL